MGDESIWKKEVSFGRQSEPKDESVPEIETLRQAYEHG